MEPSYRSKDLASFLISRGLSDFGKILIELNLVKPIQNIIPIIFSLSMVICSFIKNENYNNSLTDNNKTSNGLKKQVKMVYDFLIE